ncbi:MAG: O-antigen ligase family protein [Candidatus Neomarinimicrobiota bacterium]
MLINIIIITFTLLGVRSILFDYDGVRKSFIWIIWAFCLGYRTFTTVSSLHFHPIEIFSLICIIRIFSTNHYRYRKIPKIYNIIFFLFFIRFIADFNYSSVYVLNEFKNILLLYQLFFISQYINFDEKSFYYFIKSFLVPALYISIFGIMEYYNPSITSTIFGYDNLNIDQNYKSLDEKLFGRLSFLFWGTHLAANIIMPIFPILFYLRFKRYGILSNPLIFIATTFLFLSTVFLSGNRTSWLILTVMLVYCLVSFRNIIFPNVKKYTLIITLTFIAFVYSLPATVRYLSIFNAITGNIDAAYDASSSKRLILINDAIRIIYNNLNGLGWGKVFWVHSDLIQILACSGIVPGTLFIISLILLGVKIFKYRLYIEKFSDNNQLKLSLFICLSLFFYIVISLGFNGNYALIQCGAPIFMFWVIIECFTIQSMNKFKRI